MLDFCSMLRPVLLDDVYGQKFAVTLLKACTKNVDIAPRIFLLSSGPGQGKTSCARAFANSLAKATGKHVDYQELDASDDIMSSASYVRTLFMTAVTGFRVITIDEAQRLSPSVQAELLKLFEDNIVDEVFTFCCTTDPQDLTGALRSRMTQIELSSFSIDDLRAYLDIVLAKYGYTVSQETATTLVVNAMGCLRSLIKGLEVVLFEGEELYNSLYKSLWGSLEAYFTDFTRSSKDVCQPLFSYHSEIVRQSMSVFFREFILYPAGSFHSKPFPPKFHAKLFQQYLKLSSLVKRDADFASFLVVYRNLLQAFYDGIKASL